MDTKKHTRGRPLGSSRLNEADYAFLARAADLIIVEPDLKPTTAFRRLAGQATKAEIHRWQDKWRTNKDRLLAEAGQRRAEAAERRAKRERAAAHASSIPAHIVLASELAALSKLAEPFRTLDAINRAMDNPALRMLDKLQNLPMFRLIRMLENSPTMKMMRAMEFAQIGQKVLKGR